MNRLIVELNREYTKSEINKQIDALYDEIKKMSEENHELRKTNASIQKNKTKLAYAYAKKIGVILTQKEYNKKFIKGPLHGIIIRKSDAVHAVRESGDKK